MELPFSSPAGRISEIQKNGTHAEERPILDCPSRGRAEPQDPIGVIEYLTGKREQDAIDGKRCLFEVLILSHGDQPTVMPPLVLAPSSGGEVAAGARKNREAHGAASCVLSWE